jgi:hypothetical protein
MSGGVPKIVMAGGYAGRYAPSGHLLYLQQATLFAVRFDLDRLETVGQAVPALEGLVANPSTGGAQLAFSAEGTLAYVPGTAAASAKQIDWMTRDGKTSVLRARKDNWANPRFSPDGQRLALDIFDGKQIAVAAARTQTSVVQGKVVFVFNFFDDLRSLAPSPK